MTSQEYAEVMLVHSRLWPMFSPPPGTYEVWKPLLVDLDAGVVTAALYDLATEEDREFAPGAGQIRRRAVELSRPPIPSLDQALAEVWTAMSRVGHYGSPEWSSPAVAAAVDAMGGWQIVCAGDNPDAFRAQFARVYGSATARHEREAVMAPSVRALVSGLDLSAERALPAAEEPTS